jgi:hypothetical protein
LRARQRFFRLELPAVRDDGDYLRRRYFDNKAVVDLTVSDHTRKRYVLDPAGTILRDRYEFMGYRLLREGLEAGDLHCRNSARFRSFDTETGWTIKCRIGTRRVSRRAPVSRHSEGERHAWHR